MKILLDDAEWGQWSNNVIADKCGVSLDLVNRTRNEGQLNESFNSNRTGKDGKSYPAKKAKAATKAPTLPNQKSGVTSILLLSRNNVGEKTRKITFVATHLSFFKKLETG